MKDLLAIAEKRVESLSAYLDEHSPYDDPSLFIAADKQLILWLDAVASYQRSATTEFEYQTRISVLESTKEQLHMEIHRLKSTTSHFDPRAREIRSVFRLADDEKVVPFITSDGVEYLFPASIVDLIRSTK